MARNRGARQRLVLVVISLASLVLSLAWSMPLPTSIDYWRVDDRGVMVLGFEAAAADQIGTPELGEDASGTFYVRATAKRPWFSGTTELGFPDFAVPNAVIDLNTGREVPRR